MTGSLRPALDSGKAILQAGGMNASAACTCCIIIA